MKDFTKEEQSLLLTHMPRYAHAFLFRPPTPPECLPDINMTHVRTLVFLRLNGAAPMSTAARWLNLEKGSFTPVARRLMEAGLVESVVDEKDRRRTLLRLTVEGTALDARMHEHLTREFAEKIGMLSTSEQRTFFASLQKIRDLLDKMDPGGCAMLAHGLPHGHAHPAPAPDAQEGPRECSN
jgi:MarR family transcriptional regulator, organic hydroperoxide resistance regulator